MYQFNVRVYGILINEDQEVLISDERVQQAKFTKFPGGGLEYGEGLIDALKREFWEECQLEIEVIKHIYTTDFFEKSSFNTSQILSIYYLVATQNMDNLAVKHKPFDFDGDLTVEKQEVFRRIKIQDLRKEDLTFKTDQVAWENFLDYFNS